MEKIIDLKRMNQENSKLFDDIIKKFSEKKRMTLSEKVIIGIYVSIVEKTSSLICLIENNKSAGVDSLLRSIFESHKILKFILERHTKDRAKAYALSVNLRRTEVLETISESSSKSPVIAENKEKYTENITEIQNIKEIFGKHIYKNSKEKKIIKSKNWMKIQSKRSGKGSLSNFKDLCEYLGEQDKDEYDVIYAQLSQESHGKEYDKYFKIAEDLNISSPNIENSQLSLAYTFIAATALIVAKYYGMEKKFARSVRLNVIR